MWRRVAGFLRSLPFLIVAGAFGLYLLFGFFLVDPLARKVLPWAGERFLASKLSAERVDFNPLTLELRVQGLALAEPSGALLAGADKLYVNLDVDGVTRWAWRLRSILLERPRLRVEVRRGGALNWDALLAKTNGPPSDRMVRVLIDHLQVANGDIEYVDADRPGDPYKAAFTPLGVELDSLSTLPEDSGDYLLAARLPEQGGTLRWKGQLSVNPLSSEGELELQGARIGRVLGAVQNPLAAVPSGTLAAALQYRFALLRGPGRQAVPDLEISKGNLVLRDFALTPRGGGAPLLQLATARFDDLSFDLLRREFRAGAVTLEGGALAATRDAHGALDWAAVFTAPAEGGADRRGAVVKAAAQARSPWKFAVGTVRLAGWSAKWTDLGYAKPLSATAQAFELSASVAGELGPQTMVDLGSVQASMGPVELRSGDESVAQLQRATLVNARMALPANRVDIEAIGLDGARALVRLDKQQRLNWSDILRRTAQAPPAPAAVAPSTAPAMKIVRVAADDLQLQLVDASSATPVTLDLAQGTVQLRDVGLDLSRAIPVEAAFTVKQGGRLEAKGTIVPGTPSGQLELRLAGLSLKPFAPYVNQFAQLRLDAGAANTRGKLVFGPGRKGMALAYTGGFAVDGLAITEEDTGQPFLGWKKLSSDALRLTLGPDSAHIGELVAREPFGKVIIFEDQTLNLQRILRTSAKKPAPAVTPVVATSSAPPSTAAPPAFPVTVERLRVIGGSAEFADLSLTPQFGTRMHDLSGVVTGLSTDPASNAQVELDGQVDDYGSARIRGAIQPFRATESTDLTLAFRNLEMTRLTPYSGKFAGRKIASGRLSVDLEYKIRQRQLAGTNKFIVTRLRLGEPVDSPSASKLPLDLAIALLEDSNGVIDLDLPVSGSLDDPQFSYGAIVWKALVNVLTRIVTAPFRALGALLGGETEKFEAAGFDPGSRVLLPPEQEKLKTLAEALAKRPSLTLTIQPGYDPAADRRALQDAAMRKEAATAAGLKLAPGEPPGPVDVNNYKVQTWLEDRYAQVAGAGEYQKLRASYKDKDAGGVARVMDSEFVERLGRRFKTRDDGAPSAFHAELLDRLTKQVPIADEGLVELAQARANAMRDTIVKLGLDANRVTIAAPAARPAKDKLVGSGLSLGVGKLATAQPEGGPDATRSN
ncbi:DUF748 domain-containing protein [Ramlibacter ginsenosidimutans]|uniref:DUF748 domain-containing protein n=1 Tax=Ramlibacter ginsenosidimutans TaxID=502333 RepID=A0A934TST1_9BURK|nr:DUF748 domain-containing protein [Ramlibacter ginsenosidimutans]MBK6006703.1 DUF748 domain-containing protein [Ramlibacter ginsenosidimutans]